MQRDLLPLAETVLHCTTVELTHTMSLAVTHAQHCSRYAVRHVDLPQMQLSVFTYGPAPAATTCLLRHEDFLHAAQIV
jgi:hypothetical protein